MLAAIERFAKERKGKKDLNRWPFGLKYYTVKGKGNFCGKDIKHRTLSVLISLSACNALLAGIMGSLKRSTRA